MYRERLERRERLEVGIESWNAVVGGGGEEGRVSGLDFGGVVIWVSGHEGIVGCGVVFGRFECYGGCCATAFSDDDD